ncbi:MAG: hypothetical protein LIO46_03020 [Clostridiales bacterium]|nr:hypothetical protein [Clostridiales bacterium]
MPVMEEKGRGKRQMDFVRRERPVQTGGIKSKIIEKATKDYNLLLFIGRCVLIKGKCVLKESGYPMDTGG